MTKKSASVVQPIREIPLWIVLLVVGMVFVQAIGFDFLPYDDKGHILENPGFQTLSLEKLTVIWTKIYFGMYIPFTYTVWDILYHLTEAPSAAIFHGFNIVLHLLNVYWVRKITLSLFPNLGADIDYVVSKNVSISARPDITFTTGSNIFTGTLAVLIPLT